MNNEEKTQKDEEKKTNITDNTRKFFNALVCGSLVEHVALVSCFVNGEPSTAISLIEKLPDGDYSVSPWFVEITPGMKVLNHSGEPPKSNEEHEIKH